MPEEVFADAYLNDLAVQNETYKDMRRKLVEQQSDICLLTQTSQQAFSECIDGFTWVPKQSFEFNFHTMKWVCESVCWHEYSGPVSGPELP